MNGNLTNHINNNFYDYKNHFSRKSIFQENKQHIIKNSIYPIKVYVFTTFSFFILEGNTFFGAPDCKSSKT
jgi:hypothetical protein